METNVRTPMDVFLHPQHFVIPLFQRPYVWDREDQWAPLWADVRRLADLKLNEPNANPTHFLGAVVVQAQAGAMGTIQMRNVIDGQQRLTTLQLLMDAAAGELSEIEADLLAAQIEKPTQNESIYVGPDESQLKIRHSNKDRAPFEEVMDAEIPIDCDALRTQGRCWFVRTSTLPARSGTGWAPGPGRRGPQHSCMS